MSQACFNFLVVEDDEILRDFLVEEVAVHCRADLASIGKAKCLAEARQVLDQAIPDALLLDLQLPDGSGFDLASLFIQRNPKGRILVLTGQIDQHPIPPALVDHIHAIVGKAEGLQPLRNALWGLRRTITPASVDLSLLSPRQLEMLRLIGRGLDTAQIAKEMGITFTTAQTHRRQITGRLGVRGVDLIRLASTLPSDAS